MRAKGPAHLRLLELITGTNHVTDDEYKVPNCTVFSSL